MQILIIDNNTSYLESLKNLLYSHALSVIKCEEYIFHQSDSYDLMILSGGHPNTVTNKHRLYQEEITTIQYSDTPILGICLGFELIVNAFGGTLKELPEKEKGEIEIEVIYNDIILENIRNIKVKESHRWVVESLPPELIPLAKSKDGIEMIRHSTRCIYGFQFHPEIVVDKQDLNIFNNFLTLATTYNTPN
jgi:GMP synthase (glutamine-hydrolysing)